MARGLITLNSGRYLPVCECGSKSRIMTLTKLTKKVSTYCFACKEYNTKFIKMNTEDLRFTTNWNGKLNCSCFTTLRLHNESKYVVGAVKNILLSGVLKGQASIIGVQTFLLKDISEYVARIDTALSAKECQQMIRTMYKNYPLINWDNQLLDFVLLKYVSTRYEPKLFEE